MKKHIILFFAVLLCVSQVLWAVPARPGKIVKVQPDGSTIVIRLHGDEHGHWVTDENGQLLEKDAEGFYRVSSKSVEELAQSSLSLEQGLPATNLPSSGVQRASSLAQGTKYILVLLVEFADTTFTIAPTAAGVKTAFENMLNQDGYSANGGTGSVHEFYADNSHGAYNPVFEVYGPITLSGTVSSYLSSSDEMKTILEEACKKQFGTGSSNALSKFDSDGDGYVDAVLVYYAGYDEAQGGENTIWSHRSSISSTTQYGGKRIRDYFCTAEKRGYTGSTMCGIGTTCHEFAHFLGLPDLYDTDYEINGYAGGAYSYSVMCSGPYLNDGNTPPYFGLEERIMLGWVDHSALTEISAPGSLSLAHADNNVAYTIPTTTSNEYFVLESRGYGKWDRFLPSPGLVVYHVDKSSRSVSIKYKTGYNSIGGYTYSTGTATPYNLWNSWNSSTSQLLHNNINENGSHPCYSVIAAPNQQSLYYTGSEADIPFPGLTGTSVWVPEDWAGASPDLYLSDITYDSGTGVVSFDVVSNGKSLYGKVFDTNGLPVAGATVRVLSSFTGTSSSKIIARPDFSREMYQLNASSSALTAVTNESGEYYLPLEGESDTSFEVSAVAGGHVASVSSVTVGDGSVRQNFYLLPFEDEETTSLHKYTAGSDTPLYYSTFSNFADVFTSDNSFSLMGAVGYTADELKHYVGRKVEAISFFYVASSVSSVYALLDFGSTRKVWVQASEPVSGGWTTVDISDKDIVIPANTDIYAGYALREADSYYPLIVEYEASRDGGYYIAAYNTSSAVWCAHEGNLIVRLTLSEPQTVQTLGYNTIDNPSAGYYQAGDTFTFKLNETDERAVSSVEWYFDDEPVSSESIELPEGEHVIEARLTLVNGKKKIVEQKIFVE